MYGEIAAWLYIEKMRDCHSSWPCVTKQSSGLDGVSGHQVWVYYCRLGIWTIAGRNHETVSAA